MSRERAAAMIEYQADACASLGSGLYAALLTRAAQDVLSGGPCAGAVAGYEDAPGPHAIALRLLGGVHALALTGRAPDLAAHYPSAGGAFDPDRPDAAWPAFRATVADHMPWVRDWMTRPPQTNEVGRANLEPRRVGERHRFQLTVRLGDGPELALADAHPHGLPARGAEAS
ncbi:DUF2332 family protein [Micromonospora sp. NPDC049679]|uniref:DUF2332 family protein n=1 Tax=Micromonospora sp. NPDC049679 TaxID=3155920 RepID=UPI0033E9653B